MTTKPIRIEDLPIFDVTDYLKDEECIKAFLADAEQETDPRWLPIAQSHVERARKRWCLPEEGGFDPTDRLDDEEKIAGYLAVARDIGDEDLLRIAQTDVERARKRWNLPEPPTES